MTLCALLGACGGGGGDDPVRGPSTGDAARGSDPFAPVPPDTGEKPDPAPDPGLDPDPDTPAVPDPDPETDPDPDPEPEPDPEPVDNGDTFIRNGLLDDELADDALDGVTYGDGEVPITQGSWARLTPAMSWAWQLQGPLNESWDTDVYVIDMFAAVGRGRIERLHEKGRIVFCYFSAGTYEPYRPDIHLFDERDMAEPHPGFTNERWLDPTSDRVVKIMVNRMDMAKKVGCDGVELDNVDAQVHDTSFEVTGDEQKRFIRILANEAHERNLSVALKNSIANLPEVVEWFDLAINESCFRYDECDRYFPMTDAGKPVFHVEYGEALENDPVVREEMCVKARAFGMRTLVLPWALDGSFRLSCDG